MNRKCIFLFSLFLLFQALYGCGPASATSVKGGTITVHLILSPRPSSAPVHRFLRRFLQRRGFSLRRAHKKRCSERSLSLCLLWVDASVVEFCNQSWKQQVRIPAHLTDPWLRARFVSNAVTLFLEIAWLRLRGRQRQRWFKALVSVGLPPATLSRSSPRKQRSLAKQRRSPRMKRKRKPLHSRFVRVTRVFQSNRRNIRLRKHSRKSSVRHHKDLPSRRRSGKHWRRKSSSRRKRTNTLAPSRRSKSIRTQVRKLRPKVAQVSTPVRFQKKRTQGFPLVPLKRFHLTLEIGGRFSVPARLEAFLGGGVVLSGSWSGWRFSFLGSIEVAAGVPELSVLLLQPALLVGPPLWSPFTQLQLSLDLGVSLDVMRAHVVQPVVWRYRWAGLMSLFGLWKLNSRLALSLRLSLVLSPHSFQLERKSQSYFVLGIWRLSTQLGLRWKIF